MYQCLEAVLSSKSRVEPDLYIMANGHVNCVNDTNEMSSMQQHVSMDYPVKTPTIREYTSGDPVTEYMQEYTMPSRLNHMNERGCTTIDGCADYDEHMMTDSAAIPLRNQNYANHSGGTIPIDTNGYITNGSMRIPPEGMEATCAIAPQ